MIIVIGMIALFHGYFQLLTVSDLLIKLYYTYVLIGGRKEIVTEFSTIQSCKDLHCTLKCFP